MHGECSMQQGGRIVHYSFQEDAKLVQWLKETPGVLRDDGGPCCPKPVEALK